MPGEMLLPAETGLGNRGDLPSITPAGNEGLSPVF